TGFCTTGPAPAPRAAIAISTVPTAPNRRTARNLPSSAWVRGSPTGSGSSACNALTRPRSRARTVPADGDAGAAGGAPACGGADCGLTGADPRPGAAGSDVRHGREVGKGYLGGRAFAIPSHW